MSPRLAIIGAGMMGEALARGLLDHGWDAKDLVMVDVRTDRLEELADALGVATSPDGPEASRTAGGVLLAVKPQDAAEALGAISSGVGEAGLISIVAGLRTGSIEKALGPGASVVRAMPNTPARVGKGVTALAAGRTASAASRGLAEEVFSTVGPVVWLEEPQLDAVTALSGSGPAYVFYLAEALVDAAVELGLDRDVAAKLAFATIEGAGVMLTTTGEDPVELRAQVTSPGGTTAAAIEVLESEQVRRSFAEAVRAAQKRSRELGA